MMRRQTVLLFVIGIVLCLTSCTMLFAPRQKRDNPSDPKSVVAAPVIFNAVASSESSVVLRVQLNIGPDETDRRPAGFRFVRNETRFPIDMSDGTKIWDEPVDTDVGDVFIFEDVNEPDDNAETLISGGNIYNYAVWAYDERGQTFVGPRYDDAVTTMMPMAIFMPIPQDDGYVFAMGGAPSNSNFDFSTFSIQHDEITKDYSYGLVRFDIPTFFRGGYAQTAILRLQHETSPMYSGPTTEVFVERIVEDWLPSEDFFNLYNKASSTSFITLDGSTSANLSSGEIPGMILTFDIRQIMNDWLGFEENHGIRISCRDSGSNYIHFSASDAAPYPEIELWYYPDDPDDLP